ncbi:MAG: carboxypeptidase-like regulatory domain-containing protein [Prevotellaceae bacterium]|nr:carboxypeptidase-like regulatory domain-containing protein [Prevotellaceae bacterium]
MKRTLAITASCLLLLCLAGVMPIQAQPSAADDVVTIAGVVRNKDNRKKLENVTITLPGSNIGTVTNADGYFALKVRASDAVNELKASHVGYINATLSLKDLTSLTDLTVWMIPAANVLSQITVYADPRQIVEDAIAKIPANYAANKNLLTAFYRETVQKRRRYISLSEAVMSIYKTEYTNRDVRSDRVRIEKGRRLVSPRLSDTLAIKLMGGPTLSINLDLVKNENTLLYPKDLDNYEFRLEDPVSLDNRLQYVVSFQPRVTLDYALFYGKIYVDHQQLAFTRIEFSLDMRDRLKAVEAILKHKPLGLRFRPQEVSYLVTYKLQNGVAYLNYIRNEMRFKCDWKKRLFSATYTVLSEMVVTDRKPETTNPIPYRTAFKERQIFNEMVDVYWNEDFWKEYNILEPTESLEHAVERLKKR